MKTRVAVDRAALLLGLVSIVSALFVFVDGTLLVQIRAAGLVVALVLGLLAVVAGLLKERALVLATVSLSCSRLPSSSACWPGAAAACSAVMHRRSHCG
jgi:hypothetical protein